MVVVVLTFFSAANAVVCKNNGVGRGISSGVGRCVKVFAVVGGVVVVVAAAADGGISNVSVVIVIADDGAIASTVVANRVSNIRRHHDGLIDYDDWWCCW